jgi:hypothetical protein
MTLRRLRSYLGCLAILAGALAGPTTNAVAQVELPLLSTAELACQRSINNATFAYNRSVLGARRDCFFRQLGGALALPPEVLCRNPTDEGTGDTETDLRLRNAEASLLENIAASCLGVDLTRLGFPGFCPEGRIGFSVFDLQACLLESSDSFIATLIDFEQPPVTETLADSDRRCQDTVSRKSARLYTGEFDSRSRCTFRILTRKINPLDVDCRREESLLEPDTGDGPTDTTVVAAHDKVVRGMRNACPRVDLRPLGFPAECPAPEGQPYPLSDLSVCMFDTHHLDSYRLLNITNPLTTECGNGEVDFPEQCDGGDREWMQGESCRADCTLVACGDTNDDGELTAIDALFIEDAANGLATCEVEVCDVNGDLEVTTADAELVAAAAAGIDVDLSCPAPLTQCGNGVVDPPEETCDDGTRTWEVGDFCDVNCQRLLCGDANDSGDLTALDAVIITLGATGAARCDLPVCDVDSDGAVTPADAMKVLRAVAGLPQILQCPDAPEAVVPEPL